MIRYLWLAVFYLCFALEAHAARLTMSCGNEHPVFAQCEAAAKEWADKQGHEVTVISVPNEVEAMLAVYRGYLDKKSPALDVFPIDVVWPGQLKEDLVDLKPYLTSDDIADHFPAIFSAQVVDGKLVALPWYTDAGMLYYRRDLVNKYNVTIPTTWDDLFSASLLVQERERKAGRQDFWGYVFQGREYEGLTCNALEWIDSFGGDPLVTAQRKSAMSSAAALAAIKRAKNWIGRISPDAVLNFAEEDARSLFQSGNALFMRNWPYAWAALNSDLSPVAGKVGVIPLPRGLHMEAAGAPRHSATLGGWALAISKYSLHPELAVDLIRYQTSAAQQKIRAVKYSLNPTRRSLYEDPDVISANPLAPNFKEILQTAVARPSSLAGKEYNSLSQLVAEYVHKALSKEGDVDALMLLLNAEINQLLGR